MLVRFRSFYRGVFFLIISALVIPNLTFAVAVKNPVVTKLSGTVNYSKADSATEVPLKLNDFLEVNDKVKTYEKSSVDITFTNGNLIRLTENSAFIIKQADLAKATPVVKLKLLVGSMFSVLKSVWGKNSYQVETQTAVVGTKGTIFLVRAGEELTDVLVKEGKLGVINPEFPDAGVDVAEGNKTIVEKSKFPTAPIAMTATELGLFSILSDIALGAGSGGAGGGAATQTAGVSSGAEGAVTGGGIVAGTAGAAGVAYGADTVVRSYDLELEETHEFEIVGSGTSSIDERYDVDFDDFSQYKQFKSFFDEAEIKYIKYQITRNSSNQGGVASLYMTSLGGDKPISPVTENVSFNAYEQTGELSFPGLDLNTINNLLNQKKFTVYLSGHLTGEAVAVPRLDMTVKVKVGIKVNFKLLN